MIATFWGLFAACAAVLAEYLYRQIPAPGSFSQWWPMLWVWLPLQLSIGFGIYRLVHLSPDLLTALVVFTSSTIVLRVLVSVLVLRDVVSTGTWIALALLLVARYIQSTVK